MLTVFCLRALALAQYSQYLSPLTSHVHLLTASVFRSSSIVSPNTLPFITGGDDPHQATTAWLDRHFGMGACVVRQLSSRLLFFIASFAG